MNNYYWIKLYYELREDIKVHRLSDSAFRRFVLLMLLAGEHPKRDGTLPDIDDIAFLIRCDMATLQSDMVELELAGIMEMRSGIPFLINFEKRQASKTGAERMQALRERKKRREYYGGVTESRRASDDSVTSRHTDIDIDIDKIRLDIYTDPDRESIAELKTALSEVTKTPQMFHENDYDKAAHNLEAWKASPEAVRGFSSWWKTNGHYAGKPALKSLLNEWPNYCDSDAVEVRKGGAF